MSSREEFEKWFEGYAPTAPDSLDDCAWAAWRAATERAAKVCDKQHDRAITSAGASRALACAACIREGNE